MFLDGLYMFGHKQTIIHQVFFYSNSFKNLCFRDGAYLSGKSIHVCIYLASNWKWYLLNTQTRSRLFVFLVGRSRGSSVRPSVTRSTPGDALMTAMLDASHMTRERRCTQHPACDLSASGQHFDLTAWCKIGDAHHTDTCQTCSLSDRQAWTRPEHENIELGSVVQIRDVWQGSQLTRQTRWATINQGSCHRIQSSAGITQRAT